MDLQDYIIEKRALGCTINDYKGSESIIEIPSHFNGNLIENIGDYAFSVNKTVKQVIIPSGIKHIGFYAFGACSNLEIIVIPNTIKEIDSSAFSGCNNLKQIIFRGTRKQWDKINSYEDYIKSAFRDKVVFTPESELSSFINDISANPNKELDNK